MIKAVFFDLYHTLVRYEPPQELIESQALEELGVKASPDVLRRPLASANDFIYLEIVRRPLSQRTQGEKMALYMQYQEVILKEVNIESSRFERCRVQMMLR